MERRNDHCAPSPLAAYLVCLGLLPYSSAAWAIIPLTVLGQINQPHIRALFSCAVPPELQVRPFEARSLYAAPSHLRCRFNEH
jgi:hypothetical protein